MSKTWNLDPNHPLGTMIQLLADDEPLVVVGVQGGNALLQKGEAASFINTRDGWKVRWIIRLDDVARLD